jgi:hypothetical protein
MISKHPERSTKAGERALELSWTDIIARDNDRRA